MEHFSREEGLGVLREMRRALSPGGVAILFWPPTFGLSRWVLAPFEWIGSLRRGKPFRYFPDEVHRLDAKATARALLREAGAEALTVDFSPRAGFNYLIVVARRIAP
jgi:SAM-dependent methyltransferase